MTENIFDDFEAVDDQEISPPATPGTAILRRKRDGTTVVDVTALAKVKGFRWPVVFSWSAWRTCVLEECDGKTATAINDQASALLTKVVASIAEVGSGMRRLAIPVFLLHGGITNTPERLMLVTTLTSGAHNQPVIALHLENEG